MFAWTEGRQTAISVDCIKTCPWRRDTVAIAYYQTNPDTKGAIAVGEVREGKDIHAIAVIQTPPLLHLVWGKAYKKENESLLAAAVRTDDVLIYSYNHDSKTLTLLQTIEVQSNIFCLYLDLLSYEDHYHLLVSTNEQSVFSLILDPSLGIGYPMFRSPHEYAVWTCRLDPFHKDVFVCGDEVNSIYMYGQNKLISKNRVSHKGGICDLTFGPEENLLFSGGFDGVVCTYDTRKLQTHVERHDWGGTIWRVVPGHSKEDGILLCNSSENKFQIVDQQLSKQLWNSGTRHESLAYAADWLETGLLTASFYDRKMSFWSRPPDS